jgi:hypothetical protein
MSKNQNLPQDHDVTMGGKLFEGVLRCKCQKQSQAVPVFNAFDHYPSLILIPQGT